MVQPTWEQVRVRAQARLCDPCLNCRAGLLGDLELHGTPRLQLQDHRPTSNVATVRNISDAQVDQITRPQLAVDREIECCSMTDSQFVNDESVWTPHRTGGVRPTEGSGPPRKQTFNDQQSDRLIAVRARTGRLVARTARSRRESLNDLD